MNPIELGRDNTQISERQRCSTADQIFVLVFLAIVQTVPSFGSFLSLAAGQCFGYGDSMGYQLLVQTH